MEVIKYKMQQSDTLVDVVIGYNENNLETAKKEAYNGEYFICDEESNEVYL